MANAFAVTQAHGRVFRTLPDGSRVLVAVPGDEISLALAKECGLVAKSKPKPAPEAKKAPEAQKAPEAAKTSSYPTKPSRGK